jgi:hypothetical protein
MWICLNHPDGQRKLEERLEDCRRRTASLDHDGDGRPGGSLKGAKSTVAKGRRKKA